MTPRERAEIVLNLGVPDEVPTFELQFQLAEEFFGKSFENPDLTYENKLKMGEKAYMQAVYEHGIYTGQCMEKLDYCIMPVATYTIPRYDENDHLTEEAKLYYRAVREATNGQRMLIGILDHTFAIPDGQGMYEFAYRMADEPESLLKEAQKRVDQAIVRLEQLKLAGIDVIGMCSDYCFNNGPFISPSAFSEFIAPFLYQQIKAAKEMGFYVIKHTDGNIMPIIDQIVQCGPHALHSLDPMAGVDIKVVKEMYGKQVALCGNVHCAAMQTGTDEEVIASAEYCMTHGKPGGGYFFCTSNIPFKGMPPHRYRMVLDIYNSMKKY